MHENEQYTAPMEKLRQAASVSPRQKLYTLLAAGVIGASVFAYNALESQPSETHPPAHSTSEQAEKYYIHKNITATVFWVGEEASAQNDNINNLGSYWISNWVAAYGGVDDPHDRCGYRPCDFVPKENAFYFALPFGEFDEDGNLKHEDRLNRIPWYTGALATNHSILKNRWVRITHKNRTAYAQWEDVGPFELDDAEYVFGHAKPKDARAGIDLSPATADYLHIDGKGKVSWSFINADEVPEGPWKKTVTSSGIDHTPTP